MSTTSRLLGYLFSIALFTCSYVQAAPLQVAVSLAPIKTLVEQLGGDQVQVTTLIKPGANPHHFHPSPQQISEIAQADVYVSAAIPFETIWLPRIQATHPNMQVIAAPVCVDATMDHDHHAEHTDIDPHFWTDPLQMRAYARTISNTLARLKPGQADTFQHRYAQVAAQLTKLDQNIRQLIAPLENRQFMVWHPAWGHFAAAYGLTQIAIQAAEKQPGAKTLVRLIEQAKTDNIQAILIQPQVQKRLATRIAQDMAMTIIPADPLAADYADNLRELAKQLVQALGP